MRSHSVPTTVGLLLGAVAAYVITSLTPAEVALNPVTLFFAGAIAICAMILPGISGSFLLLIMGLYAPILEAVKRLDIGILVIFMAGCVTGLLSFTHLLKWLLRHYHDVTLAVLTGFMLGSLNKVWPWKQTVEYRLNSHGDSIPLVERNVLPHQYEQITGASSAIVWACVAFLLGVALVLVLEWLQQRRQGPR